MPELNKVQFGKNQVLYHGGKFEEPLKPGDKILPASVRGVEARPGKEDDREHAYVTDQPDAAQRFADTSAYKGTPQVYRVRALADDVHLGPLNHIMTGGSSEYRSKTGFEVTGVEPVTYTWPREGNEAMISRKRSGIPSFDSGDLPMSEYKQGNYYYPMRNEDVDQYLGNKWAPGQRERLDEHRKGV